MLRALTSTLLSIVATLASFSIANAQSYPTRPVRVIVGFPPGAGVDFTARVIAERLQATLKQPFIVENKPGVGGNLAAEYVSNLEPDGYTLLYGVSSSMVWTKFLAKRAIDPSKDLTPIASAVLSVNCVAVNARSSITSFSDLVKFAKAQPGKLTYGTTGVQSYYYIIGETLRHLGVDMLHIPYSGNAPSVTALLAREIDVSLVNLGSVAPHVADGSLRVIAVVESDRYSGAPDVPAIREVLPAFDAPASWFGFFGPRNMPQPLVERINSEVRKAIASPEIAAKIDTMQSRVLSAAADETRAMVEHQDRAFAEIIKTMSIKKID